MSIVKSMRMKAWREANPDKLRGYTKKRAEMKPNQIKEWREKNKFKFWFLTSRSNAKRRDQANFNITYADAMRIFWVGQGGRCQETKEEFEWSSNGPKSATWDRLEPDGDYTPSNVRIVHRSVNSAKTR